MKTKLTLVIGYIPRWSSCSQRVSHPNSSHVIAIRPEFEVKIILFTVFLPHRYCVYCVYVVFWWTKRHALRVVHQLSVGPYVLDVRSFYNAVQISSRLCMTAERFLALNETADLSADSGSGKFHFSISPQLRRRSTDPRFMLRWFRVV